MEVSPVPSPSDGSRFGRYVLAQRIAHGGMASVHLAQLKGEGNFSKWVAVKLIHTQYAGDVKFEKMFVAEAGLLARIDHPNVCTVFDFGAVGGTYFLAMEYLHGQTLRAIMKQQHQQPRRISTGVAARIIADAADGLHAAHELRDEDGRSAQVVHRDVSPSNLVVLYSGVTKVLDFGIAVAEGQDQDITSVDEVKGKLTYMAPEQLEREQLDRRTDVFSLGIVLWELVCGRRLFRRPSEADTVMAVLKEPIPRPSSLVSNFPAALDDIIMKALQRNPADRYQTTAAMAHDLEEFIVASGKPIGHAQVAEALRDLFGHEIDEHTSSLKRSAEFLRQMEKTAAELAEVDIEVTVSNEAQLPPAATKRSPLLIAGGVSVLLGLAVAGSMWWLSRPDASVPVANAATSAAPPSTAPAKPTAATNPVATAPAATATQPSPAQPTAATPAPTATATNIAPSEAPTNKHPATKGSSATRAPSVALPKPPPLPAAAATPIPAPTHAATPAPTPRSTPPPKTKHDDEEKSVRPMTSFE